MKQQITACLCIASVLVLASCKGPAEPPAVYGPGYVYVKSNLPYVEGVEFPEAIYAGEPFELALRVSSMLKPDALNGISERSSQPWLTVVPYLESPQADYEFSGDEVIIEMWLWTYALEDGQPNHFPGEPGDTAYFLLDMPAGDYELRVSSAASPELGGVEGRVMLDPWWQTPSGPEYVYKTYPFTVLPARTQQ
jgi:hypothetical protein